MHLEGVESLGVEQPQPLPAQQVSITNGGFLRQVSCLAVSVRRANVNHLKTLWIFKWVVALIGFVPINTVNHLRSDPRCLGVLS